MPAYAFAEPGAAVGLQSRGQVDFTVTRHPVAGVCPHRGCHDLRHMVVKKREELIRVAYLIRQLVLTQLEVCEVEGKQDVGSACHRCGMDVSVVRVLALVGLLDYEVVDTAALKHTCQPITDTGDAGPSPVRVDLSEMVDNLSENVLSPANLKRRRVVHEIEKPNPIPQRSRKPNICIHEHQWATVNTHAMRLPSLSDISEGLGLIPFQFQQLAKRRALSLSPGSSGVEHILGEEAVMGARSMRRNVTGQNHLHQRRT